MKNSMMNDRELKIVLDECDGKKRVPYIIFVCGIFLFIICPAFKAPILLVMGFAAIITGIILLAKISS